MRTGVQYTLLAVKNDVFDKFEKDEQDPIALDEYLRDRIMKGLVVKGDLDAEAAKDGDSFSTLSEFDPLVVNKSGG